MVTIKEIAREAGVSFTTVSNVIHGNNCRVSPETAERVREIMRKTGYIPNMGARALVSNATKLIAFAYQSYRSLDGINSLQDPFISELVGGLERKIHEEGYDMILSVLDTFENMNDAARRWNVDGMIVFGASSAQCRDLLKDMKKPVAFIDCHVPKDAEGNYVNVTIDDRRAGKEMTEYLLARGHRRIGFVCGVSWEVDGPAQLRWQGYQDAMQQWGVEVSEKWSVSVGTSDETIQAGFAEIYERISCFSALFVPGDKLAAELVNYLTDRGVKIPEQISIASFDDNFYARIVRPRLTTMHQSAARKSEEAGEQLISMIQGKKLTESEIYLPLQLIVRESTAKYSKKQLKL